MKRVGIAGIGFMGWIHWLAWKRVPGVEVTAICSRDPGKRAGDWTTIKGNFGPPGEQVDLSAVSVYEDFGEMIKDPTLDLIDICLPPGMHRDSSVAALASGKHVLCEKPMGLTLSECDEMLESARAHDRALLVGHVLPFFPEYAFVHKLARTGVYGPLLGGEFKRTVSDPTWIDGFFDPAIAGGPLIDLLVHDAHFVRALFGMPTGVVSRGRKRGETVEYCASLFDFGDADQVVSMHGGVINQQGRPFTHAFEIRFQEATAQFEFGAFADGAESMPLKILTADGEVHRPVFDDGDPVTAFVDELTEVAEVLDGAHSVDSILDGQLARDAIALCHAQARAVETGSRVALP